MLWQEVQLQARGRQWCGVLKGCAPTKLEPFSWAGVPARTCMQVLIIAVFACFVHDKPPCKATSAFFLQQGSMTALHRLLIVRPFALAVAQ